MKILIVSYLFAPNNEIGAIRPTKLAKYFTQKGIIVDVISYGLKDNNSLEVPQFIRNHYIMNRVQPLLRPTETNIVTIKKTNFFKKELKRFYRNWLELKKVKQFLKYCIKTFKKTSEEYDYLITSFGPLSSLFCGLKIKKIAPSIKWICDFRDPVVTEETSLFFKPIFHWIQKIGCQKADKITTVSNGFLKRICKNRFLEKRKCIPNGYDKEDFSINFTPSSGCLSFSYAGSLYEGRRKLYPLFAVLNELIDKKMIEKGKLAFHYAGTDFAFLSKEADKFGLSDILVNHSKLSRNDCLRMEAESNILVLSTWNSKKEYGVLPGKFLEYLLFNRPILCIVDGELGNSEISEIINRGNLGYSFEIADYKRNHEGLTSFILKNYNIVTNHLKNDYNPNSDIVNYYSYDNIANQFLGLIYENKEK